MDLGLQRRELRREKKPQVLIAVGVAGFLLETSGRTGRTGGHDKESGWRVKVNCFVFGFRIKGCNKGSRWKPVYLGGNVWEWVGHRHGYAGPGHSTNENKMVSYSTEMSAYRRLQESSGALRSRVGTKWVVYRRLTYTEFLRAVLNTHWPSTYSPWKRLSKLISSFLRPL